MPTKKDLIFITGRQHSGTTVFKLLLASHGAYDADEIFHGTLSIEKIDFMNIYIEMAGR